MSNQPLSPSTYRSFFSQAMNSFTRVAGHHNNPQQQENTDPSTNPTSHIYANRAAPTSDRGMLPPLAPGQKAVTVRIQMFPHTEGSNTHAVHMGFNFSPIEKDLKAGTIVKIGRKVEKDPNRSKSQKKKGGAAEGASAAEGDAAQALRAISDAEAAIIGATSAGDSMDVDAANANFAGDGGAGPSALKEPEEKKTDFIAFRSKVVSRTHAELWVGADNQLYLKDVGSSSGTFVNRLRLSASGKESRPCALKSGDVIQLGVDYQGRQEEIYKCVLIKLFISVRTGKKPKANSARLKASIRALLAAMNPNAHDPTEASATDCCICLCAMSPAQALFLAPCSHCYHYKCVSTLLGSNLMFQCPLCRQVANLDANVTNENEDEEEEELDDAWEQFARDMAAPGPAPTDSSSAPAAAVVPDQLHLDAQVAEPNGAASAATPNPNAGSSNDDTEMLVSDDDVVISGPGHADSGRGLSDVDSPLLAAAEHPSTTLARSQRGVDIPQRTASSSAGSSNSHLTSEFSPGTPINNHIAARRPTGAPEQQSGTVAPATEVDHTPDELPIGTSSSSAVVASTGAALDALAQTLANGDPLAATSVLEGYAAMLEDLFEEFPTAFSVQRKESLRYRLRQQRALFELAENQPRSSADGSGAVAASDEEGASEEGSGAGSTSSPVFAEHNSNEAHRSRAGTAVTGEGSAATGSRYEPRVFIDLTEHSSSDESVEDGGPSRKGKSAASGPGSGPTPMVMDDGL
ncbi:hypothetical protein BJ742DRAFT_754097 [Cladochytrium replicatum]|nr:hypothetical protein BJ742DRAFT_754097 [Cladochytrium replicatum]